MGIDTKVILLGGAENETGALRAMLSKEVSVSYAYNISELRNLLERDGYDCLVTDSCFADGAWSEALEEVAEHEPGLPTIVVHHAGDEWEWAKILKAGAFDLLVPPYGEQEVLSMLNRAVHYHDALASGCWQRRYRRHNALTMSA